MKKFIELFGVLILVTSLKLVSQDIPDFLRLEKNHGIENKGLLYSKPKTPDLLRNSAIERRTYDVISYDLFMDWYNVLSVTGVDSASRVYSGRNSIQLKIDSANVSTIVLDAGKFYIDSILINSQKTSPTPQPSNNLLIIPLPAEIKQGDIVNLDLHYKYIGTQNLGMYIYAKGTLVEILPTPQGIDSVRVEERIAYTMSEPSDARYWMPCNDAPYDKARAKISVRVPQGYSVASNGLLNRTDVLSDSSKIFYWSDTTQISTYLMCATASKFHEFSDWYHYRNNSNDSVEVKFYVWDKDYKNQAGDVYNDSTDGDKYNAVHNLATVVNMMENYASKYIEYPFVKYGMNAVQIFYYGGMEHQTMTTYNRDWLLNVHYYWDSQNKQFFRYNNYWGNLEGIAHELSHQWLGDLITCATWNDIWINEGGATWSEAIWAEGLWGADGYNSVMDGKKSTYLYYGGIKLPSNYDVLDSRFNDLFNNGLTYAKGGWIYHMLRTMLGDSVFFPAFRNMLHRYAFTSIETEDFKKSFEMDVKNPPVSFETYFDQWIYKAGHPIYDLSFTTQNQGADNYKITVQINQVQDTAGNISQIPYVFQMPVTFISQGPNNEVHYDTLLNNQREQTAEFYLPFRPDEILLDTSLILCEIKSNVLAVKDISVQEYEQGLTIYPNPVYSGNEVNYKIKLENYSELSAVIYDELGNKVQTIFNGSLYSGMYALNFSTKDLTSGVYILTCRTRNKSFTCPFSVIK